MPAGFVALGRSQTENSSMVSVPSPDVSCAWKRSSSAISATSVGLGSQCCREWGGTARDVRYSVACQEAAKKKGSKDDSVCVCVCLCVCVCVFLYSRIRRALCHEGLLAS